MADHSDFDPYSKKEAELKMYKRLTEKKKNEAHEILDSSKHLKKQTEEHIASQKKEIEKLKKLIDKMKVSQEKQLEAYIAQSESASFGDINSEISEKEDILTKLQAEKDADEKILQNVKTNIATYQKKYDESDKHYITATKLLKDFYKNKTEYTKAAETALHKNIQTHTENEKKRQKLNYTRMLQEGIEDLHTNLFEVFQKLKHNIEQAFSNQIFDDDDGVSYSVQIATNFEIVLMLNRSNGKFILINVRFRKNGDLYSCLKLSLNNVDKDTITIEKVSMKHCPSDASDNCIITLALLFCTFLQKNIVDLKDYDFYAGQENLSYRNMTFSEKKSSNFPRKSMYSHDFSFFSPYGFKDTDYNEFKPVASNCNENDKKYCIINDELIEGNKIHTDTTTYVLMRRKLPVFADFSLYLKSVKVVDRNNNFLNLAQFCANLKCNNNSPICQSDIFYKLKYDIPKSSSSNQKTTKSKRQPEPEPQSDANTDSSEPEPDTNTDTDMPSFGNISSVFPYTSRF